MKKCKPTNNAYSASSNQAFCQAIIARHMVFPANLPGASDIFLLRPGNAAGLSAGDIIQSTVHIHHYLTQNILANLRFQLTFLLERMAPQALALEQTHLVHTGGIERLLPADTKHTASLSIRSIMRTERLERFRRIGRGVDFAGEGSNGHYTPEQTWRVPHPIHYTPTTHQETGALKHLRGTQQIEAPDAGYTVQLLAQGKIQTQQEHWKNRVESFVHWMRREDGYGAGREQLLPPGTAHSPKWQHPAVHLPPKDASFAEGFPIQSAGTISSMSAAYGRSVMALPAQSYTEYSRLPPKGPVEPLPARETALSSALPESGRDAAHAPTVGTISAAPGYDSRNKSSGEEVFQPGSGDSMTGLLSGTAPSAPYTQLWLQNGSMRFWPDHMARDSWQSASMSVAPYRGFHKGEEVFQPGSGVSVTGPLSGSALAEPFAQVWLQSGPMHFWANQVAHGPRRSASMSAAPNRDFHHKEEAFKPESGDSMTAPLSRAAFSAPYAQVWLQSGPMRFWAVQMAQGSRRSASMSDAPNRDFHKGEGVFQPESGDSTTRLPLGTDPSALFAQADFQHGSTRFPVSQMAWQAEPFAPILRQIVDGGQDGASESGNGPATAVAQKAAWATSVPLGRILPAVITLPAGSSRGYQGTFRAAVNRQGIYPAAMQKRLPGAQSPLETPAIGGQQAQEDERQIHTGFHAASTLHPTPAQKATLQREPDDIPTIHRTSSKTATKQVSALPGSKQALNGISTTDIEQEVARALSGIQLGKLSDQVYQEIRRRLRSEKDRRGMW